MIQLSIEQKKNIIAALLEHRDKMDVSDDQFAKQYELSGSVLSLLKSGKIDGLISPAKYINIAFKLNLSLKEHKWNIARTPLLEMIEEGVMFCQAHSKCMIFIDDNGLGKTTAAKFLSKNLKNCFHIPCKQGRDKSAFIRLLAKTVGVDHVGSLTDLKEKIKFALRIIPNTIVILDDSGYLKDPAYMEALEIVDATEGACGWYQIGDHTLSLKIDRCVKLGKIGYAAMFSRFSSKWERYTPTEKNAKIQSLRTLIKCVVTANSGKGMDINNIVNRTLEIKEGEVTGDLRRAESLVILGQ